MCPGLSRRHGRRAWDQRPPRGDTAGEVCAASRPRGQRSRKAIEPSRAQRPPMAHPLRCWDSVHSTICHEGLHTVRANPSGSRWPPACTARPEHRSHHGRGSLRSSRQIAILPGPSFATAGTRRGVLGNLAERFGPRHVIRFKTLGRAERPQLRNPEAQPLVLLRVTVCAEHAPTRVPGTLASGSGRMLRI
jgi:hypothetical protein